MGFILTCRHAHLRDETSIPLIDLFVASLSIRFDVRFPRLPPGELLTTGPLSQYYFQQQPPRPIEHLLVYLFGKRFIDQLKGARLREARHKDFGQSTDRP